MCGRYELNETPARLGSRYRIDAGDLGFAPNSDVRATDTNPVVLLADGQRIASMRRWGFVPSWAKAGSYPASENRVEPAILRSGRPAPLGFLATAIARIATLHIAVPAAYRPEVHLLHKLPDSSRAGRRCCVPSPYRWIFARPAEDPPPPPLPCSQLRLASRRAFQSR